MKPSRRTQLVLLAAATVIVAVAATLWWLSSPAGLSRTGKAIALLITLVCAVTQARKPPSPSVALLCMLLGYLAILVFVRPTSLQLAAAFGIFTAVAWTAITIGRYISPLSAQTRAGNRADADAAG
jgi:hypothetical protein